MIGFLPQLLFRTFCAVLIASTVAHPQSRSAASTFDSLSKRAAEARDADRLDQAAALFRQALTLRPKWAEGWWSLGMLEYDRSKYSAAAHAFRRFLVLSPKDGTSLVMLGLCEYELGQDDTSLKHLEAGKELGIDTNPQLRLVMLYHDGILLLRARRYKAAQVSLSGLCRSEMQGEDALRYLGLSVLRVHSSEAPATGTPGAQVVLRVGHAACLTGQKKYDEAHQEYAKLAEEYPDYPNLHTAFGRFYVDENNAAAGIAEFKRELQNHPADVNARLEIAAAEYKLDSAAGLPYAEEAVKLNPRIPFAHYLLGLLYLDTDNYRKAIPELEIARKAFPKDAKLYFALGSAYSRADRKQDADRARATFERLNKGTDEDAKTSY